jgi:hypothetical protein
VSRAQRNNTCHQMLIICIHTCVCFNQRKHKHVETSQTNQQYDSSTPLYKSSPLNTILSRFCSPLIFTIPIHKPSIIYEDPTESNEHIYRTMKRRYTLKKQMSVKSRKLLLLSYKISIPIFTFLPALQNLKNASAVEVSSSSSQPTSHGFQDCLVNLVVVTSQGFFQVVV